MLPEKQTAPKPQGQAEAEAAQKEVFKEPPKKQEKNLDDLLAEMRDSDTTPAPPGARAEAPVETAVAAPTGEPSEGSGERSRPRSSRGSARVKRKMRGDLDRAAGVPHAAARDDASWS